MSAKNTSIASGHYAVHNTSLMLFCFGSEQLLYRSLWIIHSTINTSCVHGDIRKLSYRKDDRGMHPMGALKIFVSPEYAHGYFCRNFQWAFVPIDPTNVRTECEIRSFTHS